MVSGLFRLSAERLLSYTNRYLCHYLYTFRKPEKLTTKPEIYVFCYLNLHLEVRLEVGEQGEEDGEGEFEDLRHGGDSILGQGHAQVLLNGVDEHLIGLEDGPGVLQDGQEQLEGQDLRPQLVGPEAGGVQALVEN